MRKVLVIMRRLGDHSDWVPSRVVELPEWVRNAEPGCEDSATREFMEKACAEEKTRMVSTFVEFRNARFEGVIMDVQPN